MTAQRIRDMIENSDYEFYGLRYDDAEYDIGEEYERSHQWWQDDPNEGLEEDDPWYLPYNEELGLWDGGELDGTCSVGVNEGNVEEALERIKSYTNCGKNLYLIAGDYAQGGNDCGELIINNAIVICRA